MNNKLSKTRIQFIAVFIAGISAASISATASAEWSIIGLGTLGGSSSEAQDINNSGQVVGWSTLPGDIISHAFITGPNGVGMTDLGTLGGPSSVAYGINDSGQVAGGSLLNYSSNNILGHAFITGPNGVGMTDIGPSGRGFTNWDDITPIYVEGASAFDINESGQVVGMNTWTFGTLESFTTGPNGVGIIFLTPPTRGIDVIGASGINDSGQVVGYYNYGPSASAFITGPNGVGMTILDNLGGSYGYAEDINNSGQVVGSSTLPGDTIRHAFITGPNGVGTIDLLGAYGGESLAFDINESGQVVGSFIATNGSNHAFLFSNDVIIDLSILPSVIDAGWSNLRLTAINDNGQIIGYGNLHGHTEAFLLSPLPVPEPETYAMLLAGLGLLCFMARSSIK